MSREAARPLAGRGIVVTRPREQVAGLARRIEEAGGLPWVYPAIEIQALQDLGPVLAVIERLDEFDFALFISPNAVHRALNLVTTRRGGWPSRVRAAAVGKASRQALLGHGIAAVLAPAGAAADSEALLALPEMHDVQGRRIVIFRGEGGRELLASVLSERGAMVEYAECYRRARPELDMAPLLAAWARGAVHAVTVSSGDGLANFFEMLGKLGQQWLRATPVFVPHARVIELATRLGLRQVFVAGPGDAEVMAGLVSYFAATLNPPK
jgi:uroporphyrinogen-III synthase